MESAQDFFSYATFLGHSDARARAAAAATIARVLTAQLERDAATARLQVLGLRLQPHFLFNALNTISSTVYDDPAARRRHDRPSRRPAPTFAAHERPNARCRSPRSWRRSTRIWRSSARGSAIGSSDCRRSIDDAALPMGVPALSLQPLVENAVRHGASLEFGRSEVVDRLSRASAASYTSSSRTTSTTNRRRRSRIGTGLGATRDRLRLLYGDARRTHAAAEPGRFRVTLRLPARPRRRASPPADDADRARAHR